MPRHCSSMPPTPKWGREQDGHHTKAWRKALKSFARYLAEKACGQWCSTSSNLKIESDQAEVGYWIARPYWGMGICTEALALVIEHCFNVKGFSTLWGTYFPSNPASGRVMEKCGFVDTGRETVCPNLEVGSDQPVRVMRKDNDRLIQ